MVEADIETRVGTSEYHSACDLAARTTHESSVHLEISCSRMCVQVARRPSNIYLMSRNGISPATVSLFGNSQLHTLAFR